MRLLPCSSAQFDSAIGLRHWGFLLVIVKLSCLLSDKSEYQDSEVHLDIFFFFGQNGREACALPSQVHLLQGLQLKRGQAASYGKQLGSPPVPGEGKGA